MKKFLLSAAISFLLLFPLAAKNLDFYWDFGTVFAGGNLAFNNPSDGNGKPAAVKLGFNAIALGMAFFQNK